jgi:ATP-binding cassette subfamily B protein
MIAKHYGKTYSLQTLREKTYADREGVSLGGISRAAEEIGFHTLSAKVALESFDELPLPLIAHWKQNHFLVVHKITKKYIYVANPAHGLEKMTKDDFRKGWESDKTQGKNKGIILLLEPTPEFHLTEGEVIDKKGFKFLFSYIFKYKSLLVQLGLGLLIFSVLQLIFPFLTQSIVDFGINNADITFINLILLAQLTLFISQTSVGFIRSWILLHIGARVNISLISDFLLKMMKLPIRFFDTKMIGDILQRINDHYRIETFLTSNTLNTLFAMFSFIVFGAVLAIYNWTIFFIFLIGSILYIFWILIFLNKRKVLDYQGFEQRAKNQNQLIQLFNGMQEIKLHNAEKQKRWEWERVQASLFKVNVKQLALDQRQLAGSSFINEFKNILISFIAAKAVIDTSMTLGSMLAIQYIIGQLNAPLIQLVDFIKATQDAKISLERLGEIHEQDNEEDSEATKVDILPDNKDIKLENVSFRYGAPTSPLVLKNINLLLPEGKVTAIVGASGSGKTTLLKLLLKFYPPSSGKIKMGEIDINNFRNYTWREECGVVMQDGYIFSDTIAHNIALGEEKIDKKRLLHAAKTSNSQGFIETLPLSYNTKVGNDGIGLSGGQKQRVLIARAVYKDPSFLLFDEATSALDANNEKTIMENLEAFFQGRTVVVVAHRLSTVKNADQIIVLEKGEIIEQGKHEELTKKRGTYYNLVKNQLELGN